MTYRMIPSVEEGEEAEGGMSVARRPDGDTAAPAEKIHLTLWSLFRLAEGYMGAYNAEIAAGRNGSRLSDDAYKIYEQEIPRRINDFFVKLGILNADVFLSILEEGIITIITDLKPEEAAILKQNGFEVEEGSVSGPLVKVMEILEEHVSEEARALSVERKPVSAEVQEDIDALRKKLGLEPQE